MCIYLFYPMADQASSTEKWELVLCERDRNRCHEVELIRRVLNTVSLFDDMQSLQLKLNVLLDHQRAKHLKIISSQNWLENRLIEQENTVSRRSHILFHTCRTKTSQLNSDKDIR